MTSLYCSPRKYPRQWINKTCFCLVWFSFLLVISTHPPLPPFFFFFLGSTSIDQKRYKNKQTNKTGYRLLQLVSSIAVGASSGNSLKDTQGSNWVTHWATSNFLFCFLLLEYFNRLQKATINSISFLESGGKQAEAKNKQNKPSSLGTA